MVGRRWLRRRYWPSWNIQSESLVSRINQIRLRGLPWACGFVLQGVSGVILQGCTLCIRSGTIVLCIGPARGGAGPTILVPGGLFWTRRRAEVGFRRVVPASHVRRFCAWVPPAIEKWSRIPRPHRKGERERSGCKTKHRWGLGGAGSVAPSKSGPETPLCILLFFPRVVLDDILDLIESVSEGFPTYSWTKKCPSAFGGGIKYWWSNGKDEA